jgi:lipopolysaccharide exporter
MLRDMAKGSVWMIAIRLAERSLGLVSTVLLARFLVPHDFGLIAMAMSVIVTLELFSVFSFDITLIQAQAPERQHYDSAFTLNVLFRTGIAIAMVLVAKPAADFYQEPRLAGVILGLSVGWLAQAFENIGIVNFRRDMQFSREFTFQTAKRVVSFVVTVVLAVWTKSYWALVAGMVTGRVVGLVMSYVLVRYRPRFTLSAWRELMSFSVWLMFNNILYVINTRISSLAVGKLSGSHELGLYNMSREIGTLPTSELIVPIERALLSGYSRLASDPAKLRDGFLIVLSAVSMLTLPAAFGLAAVAEPLVINLLSKKWAEAIPFLQVLSFLGAVSALGTNTYPAYISLGKPRITTYFAIARLAIMVPAMFLLVQSIGAVGAAWAELGAALVTLPIGWFVLCRVMKIELTTFAGYLWRPLVGSLIMYASVRAYLHAVTGSSPDDASLMVLASAVLVGGLAYAACIAVFWVLSGRPASIEVEIYRRLLAFARRA